MKTKIRKTYNYFIRLLIIVLTYGFIYNQVFYKHDFTAIINTFGSYFKSTGVIILFCCTILLMFVNWGIESVKWQFLISKIERLSFVRSFEAVLTGVAVSSFTPNRIGEYLGRVFILEKANRIEGILITIIGSMSQFLVTFVLGTIAIAIFVFQTRDQITEYLYISERSFIYLYVGLAILALAIYVFATMLFLNVSIVTDFTNRLISDKWRKIKHYIRTFSFYKTSELFKVLLYSLARFIVFTCQYYLLLKVFSVNIPVIPAFIIISIIFFIVTMIPTIAITELGIRGSVSLFFLGIYFSGHGMVTEELNIGIVAASSTLWLINLAVPALIGGVFVFNLKFFRKNR